MSASTFAIPLALLTTTAFNVGLIVEKRALGNMPPLQLNKAGRTILTLISTPAWLAGLSLMLTGLALQVIVLAIEPISVVQPILASGVALTLVLSRIILREKLDRAQSWCVAIMAGALVLLALSQDAASNHVTRGANPLAVVAVVVPALALGVLAASWPWRHGGGAQRPAGTALLAGLGTGLLYGVSALASKGLSGVVGGSHAPVHLVVGLLASPYLYLLFACSAIAMLLYQAALQACRASVLIPVSNVVSSGFFVIVGTWLFHEQLPASPVKLGLRLAGIAAAGVVLVILGIQSRGAEVAVPEAELAMMEIELATTEMELASTEMTESRPTGTLAMAGSVTGPQPMALHQTGPHPVAARVTGPQFVAAPVTGPQPVATYLDDPEPGDPEPGRRTSPEPGRRIGPEPGQRTSPEPGRRTGPRPLRLSGPQPATVRSTGSQAAVSLSTDIRATAARPAGSQPTAGQPAASQPAGSQTWLSQAASGLLRGGRPRGKHERSRTGKTGALSSD